jgi:hypothetical protein
MTHSLIVVCDGNRLWRVPLSSSTTTTAAAATPLNHMHSHGDDTKQLNNTNEPKELTSEPPPDPTKENKNVSSSVPLLSRSYQAHDVACTDASLLYLAYPYANRIRTLDCRANGKHVICDWSGDDKEASIDGSCSSASFAHPISITFDSIRRLLYCADYRCIRCINVENSTVHTLVGHANGTNSNGDNSKGDIFGSSSELDHSFRCLSLDSHGNILLAQSSNERDDTRNRLLYIDHVTGNVTVLPIHVDGPCGIVCDTTTNTIYFTDHNCIRMATLPSLLTHTTEIPTSIVAGCLGDVGYVDTRTIDANTQNEGSITNSDVRFCTPIYLAWYAQHRQLYAADWANHAIRCISFNS